MCTALVQDVTRRHGHLTDRQHPVFPETQSQTLLKGRRRPLISNQQFLESISKYPAIGGAPRRANLEISSAKGREERSVVAYKCCRISAYPMLPLRLKVSESGVMS